MTVTGQGMSIWVGRALWRTVCAALPSAILLCGLTACDWDSSDSSDSSDSGQVLSYGLVVADINADGRIDIVTANTDFSATPNPGSVKVILQDGITFGEFDQGVFYDMGDNSVDVAVGDVNVDGKLDVLASSRSEGFLSYRLQESNGDGVFKDEQRLDTSLRPGAIAFGDVNGDSFDDIVVGGESVVIWLYPNPIIFGDDAEDYVFGGLLDISSQILAVGDLNADGQADIVAGVSTTEIGVYLQDPASALQIVRTFFPPDVYTVGDRPFDIALALLDDDLRPDIAVVNNGASGDASTASVAVLLQQVGALNLGRFRSAEQYPIEGRGTQLVVADINGDTRLDIAASNNLSVGGGISILLQDDGIGANFISSAYIRATAPWGVGVADFNRDNLADVAYSNVNGTLIALQSLISPGDFLLPELVGGDNNEDDE